jgi:hypothetical protein
VVDSKSGNLSGQPTALTPTTGAPTTHFQITDRVTGEVIVTTLLGGGSKSVVIGSAVPPIKQGHFMGTAANGSPTDVDYFSQFFGDGSDGSVTINATNTYSFATLASGVNTLSRDLYCDTLVITGSGKLNTNGHDIYCQTLLDISGAGANGIHCSSSTALPGAVSATGAPYGANGGASVAGGTGVGTTGNAGASLVVGVSAGGQGGPGGAGTSGGGSVAAATIPTVQPILPRSILVQDIVQIYPGLAAGVASIQAVPIGGGCGGGSGGGGGGNGSAGGASGAGAGGGGRIRIFAYTINRGGSTTAGAINASGFKGTAGSIGPAASRGAGGAGAGGGGGYVHLVFVLLTGSTATNCLQASGGDGGNGGASGGVGSVVGSGGDGGPGGAILTNDIFSPVATLTLGSAGGAHSGQTGGTGNALQANL